MPSECGPRMLVFSCIMCLSASLYRQLIPFTWNVPTIIQHCYRKKTRRPTPRSAGKMTTMRYRLYVHEVATLTPRVLEIPAKKCDASLGRPVVSGSLLFLSVFSVQRKNSCGNCAEWGPTIKGSFRWKGVIAYDTKFSLHWHRYMSLRHFAFGFFLWIIAITKGIPKGPWNRPDIHCDK